MRSRDRTTAIHGRGFVGSGAATALGESIMATLLGE